MMGPRPGRTEAIWSSVSSPCLVLPVGGLSSAMLLELHPGSLTFLGAVHLEEILGRKAEHTRDEIGREQLQAGVEFAHGFIVGTAATRDLVFRTAQLALKLKEVLVRLEFRIGLGDSEQRF